MSRLRISAISYLNTAPLMWDFEHGTAGAAFDIAYTLPSQCAAELERGTADIGIIPSAAYATILNLSILPGVCIASRNAVRSILLVSRKPLDAINTVALDSSSLTSVALTRVDPIHRQAVRLRLMGDHAKRRQRIQPRLGRHFSAIPRPRPPPRQPRRNRRSMVPQTWFKQRSRSRLPHHQHSLLLGRALPRRPSPLLSLRQ